MYAYVYANIGMNCDLLLHEATFNDTMSNDAEHLSVHVFFSNMPIPVYKFISILIFVYI
jgi:hypothetical protein